MIEAGSVPAALVGGAIIGLTAVMMMAVNGRILGVSGIAAGLFSRGGDDRGLRGLFLFGMLVGGLIVGRALPAALPGALSDNLGLLIGAGFCVGLGTRLGSGCTSGHGVCGMSRLSLRSIVATVCFITVAMLTVFVSRHVMGGIA